MRELIHEGSVKDVYRLDESRIEFDFSNRISVFDCPIPSEVPGKGEALCDMACHWFTLLGTLGIAHHFIERSGPKSMIVKPVKIIRERDAIVDGKTNHLVPLEFILRHYNAGSLNDRLKTGKLRKEALGYRPDEPLDYGARLKSPVFETTTKLEPVDRRVDEAEALAISKLSPHGLATIRDICLRIDAAMDARLAPTNLIHVDGKKEFGYDADGTLMVVDVFGTADEDRFWDRRRHETDGACIELSKETVRQHYRATGYKDALYDARERGADEPPIPPMPAGLVDEVAALYRAIADQVVKGTA